MLGTPHEYLVDEQIQRVLADGTTVQESQHGMKMTFAARMQHIEEVIGPALAEGKCVLCDRFTDATFAYQGGGRGIDTSRIEELQNWVQQGLNPDLTFLLDLPVAIGLNRTQSRGNKTDRFERQTLEFKEAVRQSYLDRAARYPERIRVIDASQSIEQVQYQLDQLLSGFLEQKRNPQ